MPHLWRHFFSGISIPPAQSETQLPPAFLGWKLESDILSFSLFTFSTFYQLPHPVKLNATASRVSGGLWPLFSIPFIIPVIQTLITLHMDPGNCLLICPGAPDFFLSSVLHAAVR